MENNKEAKIDVRFEDFNGITFTHFCPFCSEEMNIEIQYEEKSIKCNHCQKEINLNWNSFKNDIEDILSEKIRLKFKLNNSYGDSEELCDSLSEVIEEVYRIEDIYECEESAREVMEFVGEDFEDEHDIAKELIELLDVPFVQNNTVDYEDNFDENDTNDYDDYYNDEF